MSGKAHDIPTEPIGSIPRPLAWIEAAQADITDTLRHFDDTESTVICDGSQRKYHHFVDYCVHGAARFESTGVKLHLLDHERTWPRLMGPPQDLPDQSIADLLDGHTAGLRACLDGGAHGVLLGFTAGQLALRRPH
jgi:5-methyltetrahydropteroyltriglutamate--homocysteine methyltransferase